MKKFFYLILFLLPFYSYASGWKIHPIFDEEVTHVVDTPDYVYFTSRNMALNEWNEVFLSLFRYDKAGEELIALSPSNLLNGYSVRDIIYNAEKGYLAVLYKDYNIDLIFDNGKVINIPYYRKSDIGYNKKVNSMAIDPSHDRIYLATDFGYVAVNDKKNEVAESRIYGTPLQAFCRMGNNYLALKDGTLLTTYAKSPGFNLEEYNPIAILKGSVSLYPLNEELCLVYGEDNGKHYLKKIILKGESFTIEDLFEGKIFNIEYNSKGVTISSPDKLYQTTNDGELTYIERIEGYRNCASASRNMTEIWNGEKRKGLSSLKKSGNQWHLSHDWTLPNSPSPFASVSYANHPDKGLLVLNYGYNPQTVGLCESIPFELSAYKNGRWTNLSPSYTNPQRTNIMMLTNGIAVDPDNPQYVYVTSTHNGIVRLNLNNPSEIIHMSRPNDPEANMEGFATIVPLSDFLPYFANFSAPRFDKKGNMWMNYADWDDQANPNPHLYCWTSEDRKATTLTSIRLPQFVEVEAEVPVTNTAFVLPLLKTGNGLIAHVSSRYDESLLIVDTNNTPLDSSDDIVYKFPEFRDTDGNVVEVRNIRDLFEDPSSGYLWISHLNGVCYVDPKSILKGSYEVNRVKVARNDGTNLADYLLEGVTVNQITADSDGRKWFATAGAGVICTSHDGREIIEEFNTENSPLPDDVVYGIGFNEADNSLIISTAQGFAEYSLPSSGNNPKIDVKAYPNPVRPDFSGYVTITDIPEGSLVKISDTAGNLVKDLGRMSGFKMLWDLSDSSYNRVRSGVYHILISPSNNESSYSAVGKILVIS